VIDDQACREAALARELLERRDDARGGQRRIYVDPRALARELIDHRQAPEAAAIDAGIVNEIHSPPLVRLRWDRARHSRLGRPLPRAMWAHEQALFAIETIHALEIDHDIFAAQ
jgi:hypothetical protein